MSVPFAGEGAFLDHLSEFAVVVALFEGEEDDGAFGEWSLGWEFEFLADGAGGGLGVAQKRVGGFFAEVSHDEELVVGGEVRFDGGEDFLPVGERDFTVLLGFLFGGSGSGPSPIGEILKRVFGGPEIELGTFFDPFGELLDNGIFEGWSIGGHALTGGAAKFLDEEAGVGIARFDGFAAHTAAK